MPRQRKQLEEKIESLVSLLTHTQPINQATHTNPESSYKSQDADARVHNSAGNLPPSPLTSGGENLSFEGTGGRIEDGLESSSYTPPLDTENQLFSQYLTDFAPNFPFVTFLPSENVSTMKTNRPLTLQALLSVIPYTTPRVQRTAARNVARVIKSEMMSRSNYSFDLLQAILIHLCWYQYRFRNNHQEFYLMIQFAITLSHELGIDKSPSDKKRDLTIHRLETSMLEGKRSEQWRALLGTYQQASV
jgi:hypothetical protein